ncbi:hypothetical protein ACKAV7_014609 [Fusarium commune]
MSQSNKEARITIALQAYQADPKLSLRRAAFMYDVHFRTLHHRSKGKEARDDWVPTQRKLSDLEEEVIVQYILDLDLRGFPSRHRDVEEMANRLLADRDASPVSKRWAINFIKRQPKLKTRFKRKYDYRRAKCEDLTIIRNWFKLVENTIAKHGIRSDDIWNFDETGFMMGMIEPGIVVTSSERRGKPKSVQPGNREWATVIQAINAEGQAIDPFIVVAGEYHLQSWYEGSNLPATWVIATTENGWTDNETGLEWLKHFNRATTNRSTGPYRLLILDGHESHQSADFQIYCEENNIITLYWCLIQPAVVLVEFFPTQINIDSEVLHVGYLRSKLLIVLEHFQQELESLDNLPYIPVRANPPSFPPALLAIAFQSLHGILVESKKLSQVFQDYPVIDLEKATGTHVRRLFERCLTIGHHPKPFKEAEVVMIAKSGRRDLTEPRAWRPISLLSCLGKGLERLIARRLAWAAVHYSVLHPQQAGALPKRSATDLVTALIHDIEEAFARKKVATLVTMDVQGAFDTVMCNRLVLRLREQGWPDHLARWAGSFMGGRSARVRYQDTVTPSSPLQCGLPQGSPVSPILFLLYTEPIYRLGNPQGRFGYADDTAILSIGDTVDETTAMASSSIAEMVLWGAANGVSFDTKKTEVMHFSRSKLSIAPAVRHDDVEKHPESALRWLGIWLDSRLSFRVHVEKWAAKAKAVAYHLRGLTNTIHGPRPSAVRSAVRACVEPVLLHGSEAWYPGRTRPRWNQPTKDLPSSNQHLVQIMTKAMNQAMRAILPVWKTTPTAILQRESGIPPVDQLLEAKRLRFSARLKSLDEAHPLAGRTRPPRRPHQPTYHDLIKRRYQIQTENAFRTRLRRTDELLASCTRPKLVQRYFHKEQIPPLQIASKEKSADTFIRWVESLDLLTLVVYSDGSLSSEGVASYGFTIHQNNVPIFDGSGRLGPAEVFDAEATGALEGLKAALNLRDAATQNIFICLDNLAAATCLRGTPSDSSQDIFLEFQALATSHGAVQVLWVPGHTDIPSNEQADKLARAASSLPEPEDAQPTLAYLRRIARQKPKEAFEAWWSTSAPEQYKRLNLKATTGCPPELSLPRAALHHLLAARSLHGDFATYHERFDHDDARMVCSCGRRKAPDHIFYCRKVPPRHRLRLAPSPNATVNLAIGKDFTKFIDLSKDSEFFGKICPRY